MSYSKPTSSKPRFKAGTDEDFYMNIPTGNTGAETFGTGANSGNDVWAIRAPQDSLPRTSSQ